MKDIDARIRERVEAFVNELSDLVREAALAKVSEALGGGSSAVRPRGRGASASRTSSSDGRGRKRTSEEIDAQCEQIIAYVTAHPGEGIEAIAAGLSTSSKDLTLPVKKLLANKDLARKGHKRATKYYPGRRRA